MKKNEWEVSRVSHSTANESAFRSEYWDREISKLEKWFDNDSAENVVEQSDQNWRSYKTVVLPAFAYSARLRHALALTRDLSSQEADGRIANRSDGSDVGAIGSLIMEAAHQLRPAESDRGRLEIDAEYVERRLSRILSPEAAKQWVTSHNPRLGTSPASAVASGRLSEVVEALDARESFSY